MRNPSFWNENIEEVMGCNRIVGETGRTLPCDSDTNNPTICDTYYSRGHIAQLPLHEPCAEQLIQTHSSRVAGTKNS